MCSCSFCLDFSWMLAVLCTLRVMTALGVTGEFRSLWRTFKQKQQQQQKEINNMKSKLCCFNLWVKATALHSNPTVFALDVLDIQKGFRKTEGWKGSWFSKVKIFISANYLPKWEWGLDWQWMQTESTSAEREGPALWVVLIQSTTSTTPSDRMRFQPQIGPLQHHGLGCKISL